MNEKPRFVHRRSFDEPGHAHELTFSCYARYRFLKSDRTCLWLVDSIKRAREKHRFDLWAFVFMPEHVHMIVRPQRPNYAMKAILKSIKQPVGQRAISYLEANYLEWLPRITRQRGKHSERLFWLPGGGYDRNIVDPATLKAMIEYVHLNPARRGLIERAVDWRWSSAGWYEGSPSVDLLPDPIPPEWVSQT